MNIVLKKIGFTLIVASFVLYGLILFVPSLPFSISVKGAITGGLIVFGEVTFWVGGLILGKEVVQKYRRFFRFKKGDNRKKLNQDEGNS